MKLTENGLKTRDHLHDILHEKYGIGFVSDLLNDQTIVKIVNSYANEIDIIETRLVDMLKPMGERE